MSELDKIIRKIKKIKPFLKKEFLIKEIGIFGSYARNEQTAKSDIDILVDFEDEGIGFFKFIDLEDFLNNLTGIKIDLVCKDALKPRIGKQILSEVIYL